MADRSYLQWPFLDDAHRERAAALETWANAELSDLGEPTESELDDHCRDLVARLADGGWLDAAVGEPIDVRALCLTRETLAYTFSQDFSRSWQTTVYGWRDGARSAVAAPV